jgi:hypothetical protein
MSSLIFSVNSSPWVPTQTNRRTFDSVPSGGFPATALRMRGTGAFETRSWRCLGRKSPLSTSYVVLDGAPYPHALGHVTRPPDCRLEDVRRSLTLALHEGPMCRSRILRHRGILCSHDVYQSVSGGGKDVIGTILPLGIPSNRRYFSRVWRGRP